jgi:hypothetical protein
VVVDQMAVEMEQIIQQHLVQAEMVALALLEHLAELVVVMVAVAEMDQTVLAVVVEDLMPLEETDLHI